MKLKKLSKAVVLSLILSVAAPAALPVGMNPVQAVAEAATVKLNATKKTLSVGQTYTLKLSSASAKPVWTSSKKSVATVSSTGKVTAKAAGKATITATAGTKSYKCAITVKTVNKYVADAEFEAVQAEVAGFTYAVPKDWSLDQTTLSGTKVNVHKPTDNTTIAGSSIQVISAKTAGADMEYFEQLKELMDTQLTKEYLQTSLESQLGIEVKISNFETKAQKINLGQAYVVSYDGAAEAGGIKVSFSQKMYYVYYEGYALQVIVTDDKSETKISIDDVAEYIVNSLVLK